MKTRRFFAGCVLTCVMLASLAGRAAEPAGPGPAAAKQGAIRLALPPEVLAKLRDPIPGLEHTPTPLKPERVKWVCRYGNLRMMSGIGGRDGAALERDIRRFNVTFVTHSLGATAISFCNRYKTVEQMRQNSLDRRPVFKTYHRFGVVTLPYVDYQRCTRKPRSQTYENWDKIRREWAFLFGPLPEKIADVLIWDRNGQPRQAGGAYRFSPDVPFTLMRAFFCVAVDVNNGADGNYFDNEYYFGRAGFSPHAAAAFEKWLAETFPPARRGELFGTDDVSQLTPARATEGRAVTPLRVAWERYRCWKQGWMREQIRAFGRSLYPGYTMMSTYYSHAGAPFSPITASGLEIGEITRDGDRDALLFWEPGTGGPHAGTTLAEARAAAAKAGKKTYRFGRRSFSCSLKHMVGASYVPVVSKQAPRGKGEALDPLTELCLAESYANLVTPRTYPSGRYHPRAIERMHAFQVAHPDLFVGSRLYPRVAILCSSHQAYARRTDADPVPFSRRLMDLDIEHQFIADRHVTPEGLAPYDLVFLYRAALLTDAQLQALEQFKQRGTLVVVGPCATQRRRPRRVPAGGRRHEVARRFLVPPQRRRRPLRPPQGHRDERLRPGVALPGEASGARRDSPDGDPPHRPPHRPPRQLRRHRRGPGHTGARLRTRRQTAPRDGQGHQTPSAGGRDALRRALRRREGAARPHLRHSRHGLTLPGLRRAAAARLRAESPTAGGGSGMRLSRRGILAPAGPGACREGKARRFEGGAGRDSPPCSRRPARHRLPAPWNNPLFSS